MKLVLASRNEGKIKELKNLLKDYPYEVLSLKDFPEMPEIKETGNSFKENAVLKARSTAFYTGTTALADDSGLEVDELDGAPGIYSSRFAGFEKDDEANNRKLLKELNNIPLSNRTARFRCAAAVSTPEGIVDTAEGRCEGKIGFEMKGKGGFGYDPLFIVNGYNCTMAELDPDIKNKISHRAQAFQRVIPILESLRKRR